MESMAERGRHMPWVTIVLAVAMGLDRSGDPASEAREAGAAARAAPPPREFPVAGAFPGGDAGRQADRRASADRD